MSDIKIITLAGVNGSGKSGLIELLQMNAPITTVIRTENYTLSELEDKFNVAIGGMADWRVELYLASMRSLYPSMIKNLPQTTTGIVFSHWVTDSIAYVDRRAINPEWSSIYMLVVEMAATMSLVPDYICYLPPGPESDEVDQEIDASLQRVLGEITRPIWKDVIEQNNLKVPELVELSDDLYEQERQVIELLGAE